MRSGLELPAEPVTIGHDVVIRLCVLRPRPHQQAAPAWDLGHLDVTRAAPGRFQLAQWLAGLISGGERFPRAPFPLHVHRHPTTVTTGGRRTGRLAGDETGAKRNTRCRLGLVARFPSPGAPGASDTRATASGPERPSTAAQASTRVQKSPSYTSG